MEFGLFLLFWSNHEITLKLFCSIIRAKFGPTHIFDHIPSPLDSHGEGAMEMSQKLSDESYRWMGGVLHLSRLPFVCQPGPLLHMGWVVLLGNTPGWYIKGHCFHGGPAGDIFHTGHFLYATQVLFSLNVCWDAPCGLQRPIHPIIM